MRDPFYSRVGRVAYKGQLLSAPLDWRRIVDQLKEVKSRKLFIARGEFHGEAKRVVKKRFQCKN